MAAFVGALHRFGEALTVAMVSNRQTLEASPGQPYHTAEAYQDAQLRERRAWEEQEAAGRAYRLAMSQVPDIPHRFLIDIYWHIEQPGGGPHLRMKFLPEAAYLLREISLEIDAWVAWAESWSLRSPASFRVPDPSPEAILYPGDPQPTVDAESMHYEALRQCSTTELASWQIWVLQQAGVVTAEELIAQAPGHR